MAKNYNYERYLYEFWRYPMIANIKFYFNNLSDKKEKVIKRTAQSVTAVGLAALLGLGIGTAVEKSKKTYDFKSNSYSTDNKGTSKSKIKFTYSHKTGISDPVYFEYYDGKNGGLDCDNENTDGFVVETTLDGKKCIADASDQSSILLTDYDSISEPFKLPKFTDKYKVNIVTGEATEEKADKYVIEVEKDGVKRLIDADTLSPYGASEARVLFEGYTSFSKPFKDKAHALHDDKENAGYVREFTMADGSKSLVDASTFEVILSGYKSHSKAIEIEELNGKNGGYDNEKNDFNGYVFEVIDADGVKHLHDKSNPDKILISGYKSIGKAFYLSAYDKANGGIDGANKETNGYVREIILSNDEKILVDANNFTDVLLRGYKSVESNESGIIVTYLDDKCQLIPADRFQVIFSVSEITNELVKVEKKEELNLEEVTLQEDTSVANDGVTEELVYFLDYFTNTYNGDHEIKDAGRLKEVTKDGLKTLTDLASGKVIAEGYTERKPIFIYNDGSNLILEPKTKFKAEEGEVLEDSVYGDEQFTEVQITEPQNLETTNSDSPQYKVSQDTYHQFTSPDVFNYLIRESDCEVVIPNYLTLEEKYFSFSNSDYRLRFNAYEIILADGTSALLDPTDLTSYYFIGYDEISVMQYEGEDTLVVRYPDGVVDTYSMETLANQDFGGKLTVYESGVYEATSKQDAVTYTYTY